MDIKTETVCIITMTCKEADDLYNCLEEYIGKAKCPQVIITLYDALGDNV